MSVESGQAVVVEFTTQTVAGVATDADALPAGTFVVDGVDDEATVTISNKATGVYTASVTLPALDRGALVQIRVSATVDGVAGKGVVWGDSISPAMRGTDNAMLAANYVAPANSDVAAIKAKTDNLPANPAAKGDEMQLEAATVTSIRTGLSTLTAQQVWEYSARSLTTFGTLVADTAAAVWAVTTRTLSAFSFKPSLHASYDAAKTAAQQDDLLLVKAKTDNLPDTPAAKGDEMRLESAVVTTIRSGLAATGDAMTLTENEREAVVAALVASESIRTIVALARGRITRIGNTYTYYDSDGETPLFVFTLAENEREVNE